MSGLARYLTLLAIWFSMALISMLAGDWYDSLFNFYNALISLFLLLAAFNICGRRAWVKLFSYFCILRIIMECGDWFMNYPPDNYLQYQNVITIGELFSLLIFPLIIHLWEKAHGRATGSNDSHSRRVRVEQMGR